jgi:hypothetical protein
VNDFIKETIEPGIHRSDSDPLMVRAPGDWMGVRELIREIFCQALGVFQVVEIDPPTETVNTFVTVLLGVVWDISNFSSPPFKDVVI